MRNERRLDFIFEMIHQGKSTDDIVKALAQRNAGVIRGRESEEIACNFLQKLPYVGKAVIISNNYKQDAMKRDIKVTIDEYLFDRIFYAPLAIPQGELWVQVKSCSLNIKNARKKIQHEYRVDSKMVNTVLNKERLILLNARESEDKLEKIFNYNILKLNNYWHHLNIKN